MTLPTLTLNEFKIILDLIPYKIREHEAMYDIHGVYNVRYYINIGVPIDIERKDGKWKLLNRVRI